MKLDLLSQKDLKGVLFLASAIILLDEIILTIRWRIPNK